MSMEKLRKYIFKRPPSDYFEEENKRALRILPWLSVLGITVFFSLLLFGGEKYFELSITYLVIGLLALIFNIGEWMSRKKTPWGATASLSTNFESSLARGLFLGLLFIIPNLFSIIFRGSIFLSGTGSPGMGFWGRLLIIGIVIPLIEMNWYAKTLIPSMMQLGGVIAGIAIPTVMFTMSHYAAYGLSLGSMAYIAFFRIVTCIEVMRTKNYMVSLIPHIMLNSSAVILAAILV